MFEAGHLSCYVAMYVFSLKGYLGVPLAPDSSMKGFENQIPPKCLSAQYVSYDSVHLSMECQLRQYIKSGCCPVNTWHMNKSL